MSESSPAETGSMSPGWTPSPARALRITLLYALAGTLWILCSGWVLHRLVNDDVLESRLEIYKGWLFVAVTSGLLWLALDRYFRQLRRATQLLEESEQRSRFALEGTGQGAWDWNPQTNEVHYSARWKTMLGYEPQELADTHSEWETRLHGDDRARALAELKRHLDGQAPTYRSEHRLRCKDGSYKWVLDQGKVMRRTSAGAPLRVLGTVSDITERKHAEAALQESEARYREVVQSANSVILRLDGEGKILFINDFAQQFFGYRAEELVGGNVVGTIVPPTDSLGGDLRGLATAIAATPDQYATHENENLRRDGSRVWMSWTNRAFRDDAGRVREVLCIGHDVNRRKQAELALQESEERLRLALEAAQLGTFDWEVASGRLTWSRQHEQLWGLASGQFDGSYEAFTKSIHPEDREGVQRELQRCLAARSPFYREFRVVWPDGSVHWIAGTGKSLLGPERSPVRMHGIAREVTERKQAEQMKSLSVEVLQILNDPQPLRESARRILAAIKREAGLEAVGIRLRQGEDFPYLGADGFTQEFLDTENSLAVRTANNEFCRDEQGRVLLECTCGLVLSGKTDPANALFTPGGSAWTNDARPFLKVPAEADSRLHPRNRCIHEGYQSVALIPIRVKEQIVGLLQLNDARQNCFTAETIRFFEGIASAFGVALLRHQEAEALRTSEANLRSLFDAIPDSVVLMDTDGKLVAVNDTFATRMGRRVEECVGANAFEFLPAEVKERRRAWVAEVVRTGRSLTREDERSGAWLRHSLNPVLDAGGKVERIVSFAVDLTERRREDAVRQQWADAFEHCAHGIALGDPETNHVLACNPAFAQMLAGKPEEISGSPILSVYAPADHERIRACIAEADRVGQVRYEAHMVRPDGSVFPVQMDVVSVRDAEGRPIYRVATAQDITERRRAEDAVRRQLELQDQLAKIATSVPGMIYSFRLGVDGKACLPFCTPMIEDLWGLRAEEAKEDFAPAFALIHPADVERVRERIAASAQSLQPWHDIFRVQHPRKGVVWLEGHSMPRREPDDSVLWHGFVQDITERMQAQEALRQSEARYRLVAENGSDVIWLYDLVADHFSYVSPSVERLRGFTVEEVLAQKMEAALTPESYDVVRDQLPARLASFAAGDESVRVQSHEVYQTCRNRPPIPTEVVTTLITDHHGRVTHIQGITRDITERKRAEAEREVLRRRQELALNAARMGWWHYDPVTQMATYDARYGEIFGVAGTASPNAEIIERLHPEDLPRVWAAVEAALNPREPRPFAIEYRIRLKDGALRWVRAHGLAEFAGEGEARRAVSFVGTVADITEARHAEAQLRESLLFRREAENLARIGAWKLNPKTGSLYWTEGIYEIVEATPDYQPGLEEGFKFYDPESIPVLKQAVQSAWDAGIPFLVEARLTTAKGKRLWVEVRGWGRTDEGEGTYLMGTLQDVTERKLAEAAARESDERLRLAMEAANLGTWDRDLETGELHWSPQEERLMGYPPGAFPGRIEAYTELLHPDSQAAFETAHQRVRTGDGILEVELHFRLRDGRERWGYLCGRRIDDAAGRPARIIGVDLDITERHATAEALRRSERLQRTILDNIPDPAWLKDAEGRFQAVNRAWCQFVGLPPEAVAGRLDAAIFPLEVAERLTGQDREVAASGTARHYEETMLSPEGQTRVFDTYKAPILDEAGRIGGTIGIARDITEQKRAEAALRDREQQLRLFVEHSPAAIAMLDLEMRYLVVSRRWAADYRVGDQEILGRSHYEVFPEIPERWKAIHRRCLAGAVEKCETDSFPRADGSLDWVRWEIRPWHTGRGDVGGIIIFSELITDQVEARAALQRSELEFRAMFEMASIGMGQTDPLAGRWLRVNQKLCEITGYSAAEMVGLEVARVTHPDDRAGDEAQLRRLLGGEVPSYQREKRYVRKDRGIVWVRVNVTVIRETGGRPLRTMATIEDITERRRADERVARERQRTGFLLEFHQRAPQLTDRELYDHVLERAVQLTGSVVGFFHQVSEDQSEIILTTWNQEALKTCTAAFDAHYPLRQAGNWVDCVRQQRPVVYNDYAHSPNQHGLPAGHAPVHRFMSIPVIRDGKVRIIFGVGNKATDYDGEDAEQLQVVANELHKIMMQRAAQRQLRQLSRAVEQSPVSVVITDLAGTIEYVNPKFSEISGYPAVEAIGQNPRVLKSGETPPGHYQQFWEAILAGREWHGEFHNRRKNGELYWELASVSPITDERGHITHFVAVKEDISERKRLEAFRQALLLLGRLLNGTREPVEAGRALLQTADQLWHWDAATLDLLTPDQQTVLPVLRVDQIGGERRELPEAMPPLVPSPRMRQVMQDGAKLIDQSADDPAPGGALAFGDVSRPSATIMYVPIRREHDTVGLLSIHSYTPRAYTAEDLYTLQALADYCGGALDRIRSEQGLRTSEERYRSLVETAFDWVWEVDAEGRYTYASPKVEELLGYRPEEVLGKTPFDLMPPEEAERIGTIFQECAAGRRLIVGIENVCRHKNGSLVVLETSGAPVLASDGTLAGYRGMDRDVTRRKEAEAALKASEERFRTLVESAPSGIYVQTKERFAYLNRSAMRLFGVASPEPLLGQPVLERFAPEAREQVRERIRRLNEERQTAPPAEEKCLRMDGTAFEAEVTAVPFAYDGNPGALVFFQDVTNRNRLEVQLRQAQKLEAIGQLAGGVAHDFNNILSAILMHLSLLAGDRSLKPSQREDLGELVNEAKRGAALTRQLLMFSRRQVLQPAVLDLNSLLDNLLKMLRRLLGEHIELGFRESVNPMWIEADAGMMEQVVVNLCVNARDAMPSGGRLTLSTALVEVDERHASLRAGARTGSLVCLSVQDTGQGMDEATLLRIFEPFFTTKEVGKGTGLGLATVHGIVQQHQGWVEVESAIGQGTTFRVYLPCARPPQDVLARERAEVKLPGGKETLLVVEDERFLRLAVSSFLRQRGYQVIEAQNGEDALRQWQLHSQSIAMIVSDMVMPGGIDGLELARRLQALRPGLKVIITSGYSVNLPYHGGQLAEGIVYLPKPCEPAELAKTIRTLLDGRPPR